MDQEFDIAVIGGGLTGTLMSLACSSVGLSSIIVDPHIMTELKDPEFDGRAYSLSHASVSLLNALDLWDGIKDFSQPILDIKVSDGLEGKGANSHFVHFDHRELEEGPMGHMVEDRYIRNLLLQEIQKDPLITYLGGQIVVDHQITQSGVRLILASGDLVKAKLIVGADGRKSETALRAGIKRQGWDYNQSSIVCAVEHAKEHSGIAHQFFMPSGPLAILPLKGNFSAIVWTEDRRKAEKIHSLDDDAFTCALRPVFGDFLGRITLRGRRYIYPLKMTVAEEFHQNRIALIGDAAHGIHPLAGQGLNLGFKDIAALAEILAFAKRRGEDYSTKTVLARYAQWRRFDTHAMIAATDGINMLFSNDNLMLKGARSLGLGMVNKMGNLRRGFMRNAAGLTGEKPKLLQGKKI